MENKKNNPWATLILGAAILMGGTLRLAPALLSNFPIIDGGMFYTMINDIQANNYGLPLFTTYNNQSIPFVYPFLSFYITGFISKITHISVLSLVQFLPAIIASFSIPAFYWLAKNLLHSSEKAALAALAFAFLPRTFSWFVLGGGISRSFYQLFIILAIASGYRLFTGNGKNNKYLALTILFNSLTVLSHPEATVHAIAFGLLLVLFFGRNRKGLTVAFQVSIGVLALTSIWWLPALIRHGIAPFISATQTGGHSFLLLWGALVPSFGAERNISIFTVFALLGIARQFQKKDYFLIAWFIIPFIVEPRSAPAISIFPMALFSSIGLADVVIPALARQLQPQEKTVGWTYYFERNKLLRISLIYVIFISLAGSFTTSLEIAANTLSQSDQEAMAWVKENTPESSKFIVWTGSAEPFSDPVQEWFPALSGRRSQNTIQGQEWLLGDQFKFFQQSLDELQTCFEISCLNDWVNEVGRGYDYIYLRQPSLLNKEIELSTDFQMVYQRDNLAIYVLGR